MAEKSHCADGRTDIWTDKHYIVNSFFRSFVWKDEEKLSTNSTTKHQFIENTMQQQPVYWYA